MEPMIPPKAWQPGQVVVEVKLSVVTSNADLEPKWSMRYTPKGDTYWIDHATQATTCIDPRIQPQLTLHKTQYWTQFLSDPVPTGREEVPAWTFGRPPYNLKQKLGSEMVCRHFDQNIRYSCPFGATCKNIHIRADGTRIRYPKNDQAQYGDGDGSREYLGYSLSERDEQTPHGSSPAPPSSAPHPHEASDPKPAGGRKLRKVKGSLVEQAVKARKAKRSDPLAKFQRAVAQRDYRKRGINELDLEKGEMLSHVEMVHRDWWYGQNSMNEAGLVPSNCLDTPIDMSLGDTTQFPRLAKQAFGKTSLGEEFAVAYNGARAAKIKSGLPGNDKLKKQGEELRKARRVDPLANIQRAIVQRDYKKQGPNELELVKGEMLCFVERVTGDWWYGQNSKGQAGIFPSNDVDTPVDMSLLERKAEEAKQAPVEEEVEDDPDEAPVAIKPESVVVETEVRDDSDSDETTIIIEPETVTKQETSD